MLLLSSLRFYLLLLLFQLLQRYFYFQYFVNETLFIILLSLLLSSSLGVVVIVNYIFHYVIDIDIILWCLIITLFSLTSSHGIISWCRSHYTPLPLSICVVIRLIQRHKDLIVHTKGNTSPAAEWNIEIDPEAASIVLNSGVRVVMVICVDKYLHNLRDGDEHHIQIIYIRRVIISPRRVPRRCCPVWMFSV